MPISLSDLDADTLPFLKSSLSHFYDSGRILAYFLCDLAFGSSPADDALNALLAKANYAAKFDVQICGSAFPVVDNWLTFLPAARVCVEVPWFFTLLGTLVWFVGVLALAYLLWTAAWLLLWVVYRVLYFGLECVGGFGLWAVGVLGGWLGMGEVDGGEVPVVVVVDTEG